jgi:hypothetical protein
MFNFYFDLRITSVDIKEDKNGTWKTACGTDYSPMNCNGRKGYSGCDLDAGVSNGYATYLCAASASTHIEEP